MDYKDKSIIGYRPNINFVEPEVDDEPLVGTKQLEEDPQEAKSEWDQLDKLAEAGRVLAEAFQARVDAKVGDFAIKLDPQVDRAVIDAMKRRYPDADPTQITFSQYRTCREGMRQQGDEKAATIAPNYDVVKEIRSNPDKQIESSVLSPEAKQGLGRPDLNRDAMVVEPIDIDEFQDEQTCLLMNLLWKKFIKKALTPLVPPPLDKIIPDELC